MALDWSDGPLAEGLRCYNSREFFEAHEHWESVWLKCQEPEKKFLQALIQITVAFHHLQRNNRVGAVRLLTAALRKLDLYAGQFAGVRVAELRDDLRAWIVAMERENVPGIAFPEIHAGPTT